MAYLLDGGRVGLHRGHNIVSDGTVTGNIQIAGSGQPVVILSDRGTVGGYPKIATIVTADLGRFAQLPVGQKFNFAAVSVQEAQVSAREFALRLDNVKPRVEVATATGLTIEKLVGCNVAGDAFDAIAWSAGARGAGVDWGDWRSEAETNARPVAAAEYGRTA